MTTLLRQAACLLGLLLPLQAAPIAVNFVDARLPGPVDVPLPFRLNNTDSALFLRFAVPDASLLSSLTSVRVTIAVHDDSTRDADESGRFQFALPGMNLFLGDFGLTVDGTTAANSQSFSALVDSAMLPAVLDEIRDNGRFRIRVQRTSGDFVVVGGNVEIDATLVPEPSSFALLGLGVAGLGVWRCRGRV